MEARSIPTVANRSEHTGLRADVVVGSVLVVAALALLAFYEVGHASGFSFGQLWYAVDDYDEGVYMATGALMAHGYTLYSQIYSAQPPVLTSTLALSQWAFGDVIGPSRAVILAFGMICVGAVAAIAYQARGWAAAGAAAVLLVISPEFLVYAHAVEEEVPSMALGAASLALALYWARRPGPAIAAGAGLVFGLAVLTKFFAGVLLAPMAVIVVIAIWDVRSGRTTGTRTGSASQIVKGLLGFVAGATLPITASFLVWGGDEWRQMVTDRISASTGQAAIQGVSSLHLLRLFLATDPGLMVLAVAGTFLLLIVDWRMGLVMGAWGLATLLALMVYHPLFGHHLIILLAPAGALAGVCVSYAIPSWGTRRAEPATGSSKLGARNSEPGTRNSEIRVSLPVTVAALAASLIYIVLLPRVVSSYSGLLVPSATALRSCPASSVTCGSVLKDATLARAGALVRAHTAAGSLVAAGDPWICVDAGRLCVPDLVDTSYVRVKTGKLTAAEAISTTRTYRPAAIALARGLCTFTAGGRVYMQPYVRSILAGPYRLLTRLPLAGSTGCPQAGIYLALPGF
jgi:4-amino-4-deoxy-L-arabinose transferase-like glycosyltransferase